MTRDDVEELLRQVHEGESMGLVEAFAPSYSVLTDAFRAYRDWLAVEADPDSYCDPAANWHADEIERVKDRARCDLMDAIDRLLQERAA